MNNEVATVEGYLKKEVNLTPPNTEVVLRISRDKRNPSFITVYCAVYKGLWFEVGHDQVLQNYESVFCEANSDRHRSICDKVAEFISKIDVPSIKIATGKLISQIEGVERYLYEKEVDVCFELIPDYTTKINLLTKMVDVVLQHDRIYSRMKHEDEIEGPSNQRALGQFDTRWEEDN